MKKVYKFHYFFFQEMVSVISQRSSLINLSFSGQSMMKKININTLTQCLKQLHQFEEILCTTSSIEDSSQHNALKVSTY